MNHPSTIRRAASTAAWLGFLVMVLVLLDRLGRAELAPPPVARPGAIPDWASERDAPTMAFALLRAAAVATGWYLLVVTLAGLAARAARLPGLVRATDRATPPAVRRLLAGVGLAASTSMFAVSVEPGTAPARQVEVHERAGSDHPGTVTIRRVPDRGALVLERMPDDDPVATMTVADDPPPPEQPTESAEPPISAAAVPPGDWTVLPGESFWSIAESRLRSSPGGTPTEAQVSAYWLRLVELNRSRLVDPTNPDLVLPGQELSLPSPPAA